jgi:hypothetical protein
MRQRVDVRGFTAHCRRMSTEHSIRPTVWLIGDCFALLCFAHSADGCFALRSSALTGRTFTVGSPPRAGALPRRPIGAARRIHTQHPRDRHVRRAGLCLQRPVRSVPIVAALRCVQGCGPLSGCSEAALRSAVLLRAAPAPAPGCALLCYALMGTSKAKLS